jgi:hypothetical protein
MLLFQHTPLAAAFLAAFSVPSAALTLAPNALITPPIRAPFSYLHSEMTEGEYHRLADSLLDGLQEVLEVWDWGCAGQAVGQGLKHVLGGTGGVRVGTQGRDGLGGVS